MSNYSKIQFISWEVHTGPFTGAGSAAAGHYSGLTGPAPDRRLDAPGQCRDIEARLAFTADALAKAEADSDRGEKTLKLFMAPEFLFRGAGGAYLQDLIGGWQKQAPSELALPAPYDAGWGGLFGGLRALAANPKFEDWLFVFGTAVGASFPAAKARDGGYLLDPAAPGEIYNIALVQRGGAKHGSDCFTSRKHYISGIDFVNWNAAVRQHTRGTVLPLDADTLVPADAMGVSEGGAVFRIPNVNDSRGTLIDFGIEICLDHACSAGKTRAFGRLRTAGQPVRIQLVPSGGMYLQPESIWLRPDGVPVPRSYAFNCDGLGNMDGTPGSHTQLWKGGGAADRLAESSGGQAGAGTVRAVAARLDTAVGAVDAAELWNNGGIDGAAARGAGHVRVLAPLDL